MTKTQANEPGFVDKLEADSLDAIVEVIGAPRLYNDGKSAMRNWFLNRLRSAPPVPSPAYGGVREPERCPECRGTTFAQVDDRWPGGGFRPGSNFRCVECKLVTPGLSPVAVEEADAKAWIVALAGDNRFRCFKDGLPSWTDDREQATRYARREDAEAAHQEDDDVWRVLPYAPSTPSPQIGKAGAGPVGEAVADEGWHPIETAPTGGKFGCFLMLAFGPPGDQTVSEGMHFQGRFYAASVFYTGGPHDTKQFAFREHEVRPTHWRHTLAAPGASRPVEEPGEVERLAGRVAMQAHDIETFWKPQFDEQVTRAETAEAALAETRTALRQSQRALMSLPGPQSLEVADCIATNRAALTGDAQERSR